MFWLRGIGSGELIYRSVWLSSFSCRGRRCPFLHIRIGVDATYPSLSYRHLSSVVATYFRSLFVFLSSVIPLFVSLSLLPFHSAFPYLILSNRLTNPLPLARP